VIEQKDEETIATQRAHCPLLKTFLSTLIQTLTVKSASQRAVGSSNATTKSATSTTTLLAIGSKVLSCASANRRGIDKHHLALLFASNFTVTNTLVKCWILVGDTRRKKEGWLLLLLLLLLLLSLLLLALLLHHHHLLHHQHHHLLLLPQ